MKVFSFRPTCCCCCFFFSYLNGRTQAGVYVSANPLPRLATSRSPVVQLIRGLQEVGVRRVRAWESIAPRLSHAEEPRVRVQTHTHTHTHTHARAQQQPAILSAPKCTRAFAFVFLTSPKHNHPAS